MFDKTQRTNQLVFDFDTKLGGSVAVARDAARLKVWLRECGGRWISDHNPGNGGRHVVVPLAAGETFRRVNVEPVMRLLAARLPTLDIGPMVNERTGALTPPGSATKEGCHRILDGSITEALDVLDKRSEPGLIARLRALLGDTIQSTTAASSSADRHSTQSANTPGLDQHDELPRDLWEGHGSDARLRDHWRLTSPIPEAPAHFAATGTMPTDGRWPSPSEARQSVLYHSALRGLRLTDIQTRIADTSNTGWAGLTAAYARYDLHRTRALNADWTKACQYASQNIRILQSHGHSEPELHTPPVVGNESKRPATPETAHTRWLAGATAWVHLSWPGLPYRWTVLAVLQALAYAAYVAGETGADGTPLVEVGVRSLGMFAGLMPFTTLADVLAHIRELPGAPVHRIRRAAGTLADRYSLVTAHHHDNLDRAVEPVARDRVQVAAVHDAWRVIGLNKRAVYELITHTGLTRPADIFAAARISARTGHDILAELARDGLINRGHGTVAPGETTLDDIARRHGLYAERAERLAEIKKQRRDWRTWLEIRHGMVPDPEADNDSPTPAAPWDDDQAFNEAIWAFQMASGPPPDPHPFPDNPDISPDSDDDDVAIALLQDMLGAQLIQ
ncbi:hypothetical protein [Nocardia sp. NPDC052566]|uniref:hypothetical protein n=1 Tax=Nocardia sp. NPDC052566 TaxID=3364330 RepID=UPI0037C684A2